MQRNQRNTHAHVGLRVCARGGKQNMTGRAISRICVRLPRHTHRKPVRLACACIRFGRAQPVCVSSSCVSLSQLVCAECVLNPKCVKKGNAYILSMFTISILVKPRRHIDLFFDQECRLLVIAHIIYDIVLSAPVWNVLIICFITQTFV